MEISSSIVLMQPGMYILRHPKGSAVPLSVCRAPSVAASPNSGKIEILSTPKTQGTVLRDGADCIVMLISEAPVELLVSALVSSQGVAPSLRIDQIGLDAESSIPAPKLVVEGHGISIIGHVEAKGDVVVKAGELLGDPKSGARLEGFQIMWPDRPAGVELVYTIAVEGVGSLPAVKTGNFCGTRGEARRITELTIALTGPEATKYQLQGVAHFSGGFELPLASGMPMAGPSGVEHLTGLVLNALPKTKSKVQNPWEEPSRTKVFKAKVAGTGAAVKGVTGKTESVVVASAKTKNVAKKSDKSTVGG